MPQPSDPVLLLAGATNEPVRYTELPLQGRELLRLMRMFIAARLDYAQVARPASAVVPNFSRAIAILTCHLLLEVSRTSTRRLLVAGPCHAAITEDELLMLAATDLAQTRDPRLPDLLARLCAVSEDSPELAPVLAATRKLGEALLQEGQRIAACHLLPPGKLPAIH